VNQALSGAWRHFLDSHADAGIMTPAADMFASGARAALDLPAAKGADAFTTSSGSSPRG
jgi:hypothetical protein